MGYILLVEDNQMNADMVIRILQSASIEVRHALKGLEGAQMARKERPDLILMDFDLPDVDGRTMALVLKKQLGGEAAPPIVAVTARSGDAEMRIAQKFGCVAFVSKPFVPEEFLALVKSLLLKAQTPKATATQTTSVVPKAVDPLTAPITQQPAAQQPPVTAPSEPAKPATSAPTAQPSSNTAPIPDQPKPTDALIPPTQPMTTPVVATQPISTETVTAQNPPANNAEAPKN